MMTEGDRNLSPFFSHPTVLNLVVVEGSISGTTNAMWDLPERNIVATDLDRARICYEEAMKLFERAHAPRGIALLSNPGCVARIILDKGLHLSAIIRFVEEITVTWEGEIWLS